ncbi:MAG: 6-carboxytetrahydropterin synthase [Planctomycetia bacterium]|nr:6-carboxytetrahydropterin synthase [Planctomycetia bacterium]
MYKISRQLHFSYGHRLLGHQGKCRFLHGHNGRVRITLSAEKLNHMGMLLDFGEIRSTLEQWIDEELDHRTLLHQEDPLIPILMEQGEPVVIFSCNPTAENIAKYIFDKGQQLGFPITEVRVWETPKCAASYGNKNH